MHNVRVSADTLARLAAYHAEDKDERGQQIGDREHADHGTESEGYGSRTHSRQNQRQVIQEKLGHVCFKTCDNQH